MQTNATIGNTIEIRIDVTNADSVPVVLTGSDFLFTASTLNGDFSIVKTDVDGIEIDEAVVGRLWVTLDPADTSSLLFARNLLWDCQMTDVFNAVRTIAKGKIALSLPVSSMVA